MDTTTITIDTGSDFALADLTPQVRGFLADVDAQDGLLHVFVPHATAGVTIMELEPGTKADTTRALEELLPRDDRWAHVHGSGGHGADHVLPLLISPSISVPVVNGELMLGTWQSVALVDPNVDNPTRTFRLSFLRG